MDDRRYFGLDALRGSLMVLGIVLHGGMFYLAEPPIPIPTDANTSLIFDALTFLIHSFRMQAFFVLAGFFAALLMARRGVWGTLKDRFKRIFLPMVAGAITILPVTAVLSASFGLSARFGTHDLIPNLQALRVLGRELVASGLPIDKPALGHLWFLEYLCLFYLLVPFCRWGVDFCRPHDRKINAWLRSAMLLPVLGIYTAMTSWPFRGGQLMLENTLLVPHVPSLIYFGTFFVSGYLLHHFRDFLTTIADRVPVWALLSFVLAPLAGYFTLQDVRGGEYRIDLHFWAVILNGLFTWALVFLFMGIALRYFDRNSPWIIYVSQSAYWVFLIHLPLVTLSAWWLIQFDLPAMLKFSINCAFALTVAMTTFHYGVQRSWLSVFLHGRKFQLSWPWAVSYRGDKPAP